jgi:hypothetical protein
MSAIVTTATARYNDARARAVEWLTAWDAQGLHRTATDGDEAGALWLAREAAALGIASASEVFTLVRVDPVACYLELDGERISGVPAFDTPATGADGVAGNLSLGGSERGILVAELTPGSVYSGEYDKLQRGPAHRALVILCTGMRPGIGLLNAERFRAPYAAPTIHLSSEAYAAPTIHLSSEAREAVLAGASRGAAARLVTQNRYLPATARNVVVTIRGRAPSSPPLVVMPRAVPGGNRPPSGVAGSSAGSKHSAL